VVEVGADEIVLRVDVQWVRFTQVARSGSDGVTLPFEIGVDGRVRIGEKADEMDMAAEEVAREMLAGR
jgi:hypothetical protein